jgi:hypothetical protein
MLTPKYIANAINAIEINPLYPVFFFQYPPLKKILNKNTKLLVSETVKLLLIL